MMSRYSVFLVVVILSCLSRSTYGFPVSRQSSLSQKHIVSPKIPLHMSSSSNEISGDPLRAATGIRPSLHPTTINAIAEALKARASNLKDMPLRIATDVKPIDVALSAGKIASSAIAQRQESSDQDGMRLTGEEEQTIAGRVLGVIMRFDDLETALFEKVEQVSWIAKYNEWATFGVLSESSAEKSPNLDERILDDPLFSMSRAECLLALFLQTVEIPQLKKAGSTVPDGSKIDFLDADRAEVLLSLD